MDDLLWARVSAAFLVDSSLAALCGLLLAERWLAAIFHKSPGPWEGGMLSDGRGMKIFAGLLLVGSCWQLILLAITFSGESRWRAVIAILPVVVETHAGGVLLKTCVAACAFFAATWLARGQLRSSLCGLLALCFLGLHGAVGHAAVDGLFSWAEGLQWAHLLAMALWSGGVMVSGLLVVPRISGRTSTAIEAGSARQYLELLSSLSTWCVALVLLTGVVKGYRVTGGIALLRSSYWGRILLLKAVMAAITVCLGARTRWLLGKAGASDKTGVHSAARTLRAEAVCMTGVLLLSAWLANSALPME